MKNKQLQNRITNGLIGGVIGLLLSGLTISIAKAEDSSILDYRSYDVGYEDGFIAGLKNKDKEYKNMF